ncbi:MAG: cytochrome C [Gallionella sp.]
MKFIVVNIVAVAGVMIVSSAMATDMPPLAKSNGCTLCHAIDHKVVGPAWVEVAKKYNGVKTYKYSLKGSAAADAKEYPLVEGLMMKVTYGGYGNWGHMPMPPNDTSGTKQGEIKKLVHFVLGLSR